MNPSSSTAAPTPALRVPWRTCWPVGLVGVCGLVLSLSVAGWFAREARRLDEARFYELANATGVELEHRVESTEALLRNLQRALNAKAAPDLVDWDEYMNQASPAWNFPGLLAIGYATNAVPADTLAALQAWAKAESSQPRADFHRVPIGLNSSKSWRVWLLDVYGDQLRPLTPFAAEHEDRQVELGTVHYRRFREPLAPPLTANSEFAWVELKGEPHLGQGSPDEAFVPHAVYRDDVKISRSEPVLRRADGTAVRGATLVVPTYHPLRAELWRSLKAPDLDRTEVEWLRWNLNTGFLFAPVDFTTLLRHAQGPGELAVRVEIHAARSNLLSEASWLNPDGQPMRAADAAFRPAFSHKHPWAMFGDQWTLFFHTTPIFDAQSTRYRAWWAGGGGLLVTAVFCWALSVQIRGRWREAVRAVALREARDALQAAYRQRERLSHDLHDGAIQSLYAVQLGLSRAARDVQAVAPEAGARLQESRSSLDVVIGELRHFITQLENTGELRDAAGLATVLDAIVRRLRLVTHAAIELHCDEAVSSRFTPVQAVQLASLAREALSNSLRHAGARRVRLRLAAAGDEAVLEVDDDGRGFDLASSSGQGLGLRSIRLRAADLGGRLDLESTPGVGTTVRVTVPLLPATANGAPAKL